MKISELNQHCGVCALVEFCGNPFGYCICTQERFEDIDDEKYKALAWSAPTKTYKKCCDCPHDDDGDCADCDSKDDARDYYCEQIAAYVCNSLPQPPRNGDDCE